jgi:YbgC/YbaW family acyl-CoA thioester hydrolase
MNLFFRVLIVTVLSSFQSNLSWLEESLLYLQVWPQDLDINRHVNNGRYLSLMDLGRRDLLIRTGMLRVMRRHKWSPVIAASTINYLLPLHLWDMFYISSRIVCWDDKYLYYRQQFHKKDGQVATVALVRAAFLSKDKKVVFIERVFNEAGAPLNSPEWPENIADFVILANALKAT